MWCDRILGNLRTPECCETWAGRRHDALTLQWRDCLKRSLRAKTTDGTSLRIVLPAGVRLDHQDVLADDGQTIIVVCVEPTEVMVARPTDQRQSAALAWQFGSMHLPTQIIGDELLVIPDGPAEAAVHQLGVSFITERRHFRPTSFLPEWEIATPSSD